MVPSLSPQMGFCKLVKADMQEMPALRMSDQMLFKFASNLRVLGVNGVSTGCRNFIGLLFCLFFPL